MFYLIFYLKNHTRLLKDHNQVNDSNFDEDNPSKKYFNMFDKKKKKTT